MTTTKKQARPQKPTARTAAKTAAKPELTTYEQRTAAMPSLQPLRQAAAKRTEADDELAAETEAPAFQPLSEKDVILRLVEMLKSL